MGPRYLQVAEAVDEEPMELPTETDGTLLLSTLAAQYPGATGLKFRNPDSTSGAMRGVRLADGRFHSPEEDGWGDGTYYCVMPKIQGKRRKLYSDSGDEEAAQKQKQKILEYKNNKCSDLIVLSLPYKTTDEELKEYFSVFGDVSLAKVKRDTKTGESKGYGFIRFSTLESQIRALGQRHNIGGRWCDAKIPNSKESQELNVSPKIYVGRLTEEITADELREYFSSFGEVTHVYTPKPFRAFAFVTFVHGAVAQSLCGEEHVIKGVSVIISDAAPRGDTFQKDNFEFEHSGEQNASGSRWSGGTGAQFGSSGSGSGGVGFGFGNGQGMMDDAGLGNLNFSPQLNQAIVSAVLNQVVTGLAGGTQGQGQGQVQSHYQQQQQRGGGQSASPQNNGNTRSPGFRGGAVKRDFQGRLR